MWLTLSHGKLTAHEKGKCFLSNSITRLARSLRHLAKPSLRSLPTGHVLHNPAMPIPSVSCKWSGSRLGWMVGWMTSGTTSSKMAGIPPAAPPASNKGVTKYLGSHLSLEIARHEEKSRTLPKAHSEPTDLCPEVPRAGRRPPPCAPRPAHATGERGRTG